MENDVFDIGDMFEDEQPEFVDGKIVDPIPLLADGWGRSGDYWLVGNGSVTNPSKCGKFFRFVGCNKVHLHNKVGLDGVNYVGKVFVKPVHKWCGKPSCPVCFKYGWAIREAGKIEARLTENGKFKGCFGRFGQIEHIVCSVPAKDYGLSMKACKRKVYKILRGLGVVGGVVIPHGFRYNLCKGWYWSPHFHILGSIFDGFSKCRNCVRRSNCDANCNGFYSRAWKNYQKTEYYTKVMSKRKTVFGSAWYQLHHSSYKVGGKHNVIVSWFGSYSYRKLKVTVEVRKQFCPLCSSENVYLDYLGGNGIVTDRNAPDYKKSFFADFMEDGVPVWVEKVGRSAGARITEDDYFHFPSKNEFANKRKMDSMVAQYFPERREVWHGGLPKKQF